MKKFLKKPEKRGEKGLTTLENHAIMIYCIILGAYALGLGNLTEISPKKQTDVASF